jgi:hypothetical protein
MNFQIKLLKYINKLSQKGGNNHTENNNNNDNYNDNNNNNNNNNNNQPNSTNVTVGFNLNDYYYHGTSSVYLPYILRYGLGKYPDELFDELEKLHNYSLKSFDKYGVAIYKPDSPLYVELSELGTVLPNGMFLSNGSVRHASAIYDIQKRLHDDKNYETYFAKDISFASKYGINGSAGDSAKFLVKNLIKWVETNQKNDEIKKSSIWETCNNLLRILNPPDKRQIILAIKISNLMKNDFTASGDMAVIKNRSIDPRDLFVYISDPPSVISFLDYIHSNPIIELSRNQGRSDNPAEGGGGKNPEQGGGSGVHLYLNYLI